MPAVKAARPDIGIVRPRNPRPPIRWPTRLKAWKKSRGPSPYLKPLALMASLSFGVASVALPAVINHWVQYPLYALSAASLYAGFRRKHMARKP